MFQVIDWLGPFLAFESTPLRQVAQEFRERFGVHIEIIDDVLSDRTVTGWFSDLSVEEMVAGICAVVEAQCAIRDGTVRMAPRSSPTAGNATPAAFEP
jgi:ferric-dicitrate binding protein FerR (iron transport regulator)